MGDDKKVYALEANTIPGMTPTSLVPKAARACGISYDLLVEIILNYASLKL
jgi:D-alanine-D-alanine ligase